VPQKNQTSTACAQEWHHLLPVYTLGLQCPEKIFGPIYQGKNLVLQKKQEPEQRNTMLLLFAFVGTRG
jgi:hypothetical protein